MQVKAVPFEKGQEGARATHADLERGLRSKDRESLTIDVYEYLLVGGSVGDLEHIARSCDDRPHAYRMRRDQADDVRLNIDAEQRPSSSEAMSQRTSGSHRSIGFPLPAAIA